MAIPSRSDLVFYQNTLLDDADWEANFEAFLNWLTDGTADLIFNTLTLTEALTVGGDVTVTGNVTATNYYGNGSNLTGISASSSGVSGLQALASQNLAQKTARIRTTTSKRANIVESFVSSENFTATLQSNYTANQTLISMTLNNYNYAPLYTELIAENTATGAIYEFQCESLGSDSYPTVTYVCTPINANLTAGTCNIYRSTLTKNLGTQSASILTTSRTGNILKYQTVATRQVNLPTELSSSSIDWEIQHTLPSYILSRTSGDVTTTTFVLTVGSNVSTEFITADGSGTSASGVFADRNKCIVCKNINGGNGSQDYLPASNGGIFTVSSVSYTTGELTLTVAEDTSTVIGTDYTNKNVTYICSPLYVVPKISCVSDSTTSENFVEQTPSIMISGNELPYSQYVHSHWKLDELSGNAINSRAGATYDLTQTGTVPSTAGKLGGCRGVFSDANYFSWNAGGSSGTVYDTDVFGVEFWFKSSGAAGLNQHLICKGEFGGNGWAVMQEGSGTIYRFYTGASTVTFSKTYNDGLWHHCFCGYLSGGANDKRVYVDGALDAQGTDASWTKSTANFVVGRDPANANRYYTGLLDDIAYWNTLPATWAAIEAIIAQRYANGLGRGYGASNAILSGTATAQSGARLSAKADLLIPVSTGWQRIDSILIAPQ